MDPAAPDHTDEHGRLPGLIRHSDTGARYIAIHYTERLADAALASIGSDGDSSDNAMAEFVNRAL